VEKKKPPPPICRGVKSKRRGERLVRHVILEVKKAVLVERRFRPVKQKGKESLWGFYGNGRKEKKKHARILSPSLYIRKNSPTPVQLPTRNKNCAYPARKKEAKKKLLFTSDEGKKEVGGPVRPRGEGGRVWASGRTKGEKKSRHRISTGGEKKKGAEGALLLVVRERRERRKTLRRAQRRRGAYLSRLPLKKKKRGALNLIWRNKGKKKKKRPKYWHDLRLAERKKEGGGSGEGQNTK